MTRIHADWRSKIHDILRAKRRKKLTGDYIQQSLDYFEILLPHLQVGREVVLKRERISAITEGLWSESSITKFFQHLARTEVLDCRNAGANGLGIRLLRNLTESPWRNRRPSEEAEIPPLPIPDDDDYSSTVDLDLAIEAIDAVAGILGSIELSDERTAVPPVQESNPSRLERALKNLAKIRAALVSGDDAGLSEVINEPPFPQRAFYRSTAQSRLDHQATAELR
jgi:hypothetical protein